MSGEQFCRLLKDLGYEGSTSFSLDWLFDYEMTKPMLQWMVATLKPGNVLSSEELQQWQKILESDEALELDDVAKSLAEIENPTEGDSLEAMRERVAALEKQHEAQSVQLGQLVAQKDKMLALKSAETASIAQLEAHISTLSQEDSQIAASNASIAAEVAAAATNIVETSRSFVSAEPLKALSSLRVAFEEANKQLAEEIERTIDAGSRRPALDGACADPDGDFANNNAELARLQQVYSISQQRFLESAVALAGAEAATEAAKTRKGKEAQWASMDAAALKTRLVEVQEQVAAARANVTTQTSKTIPALCREIAELQATAVLLADCEEKISRQRRYAEKHDIIVAHLQEQEARLELASRAVHREAQRHKQNATLLSAIIKECNTRSHAAESRAQQMQSLSGARLTDDKDAVDPRDTLLQSLYRLLSAEPKLIPPYLSREQLLGAAQELQQSVEQSQTELAAVNNDAHVQLNQTTTALTTLRPLLANDLTGEPLVPQALQSAMQQLEEALTSFTAAMDAIIKDRDAKKRMLDGSEDLALERLLFVYFFTSPGTLRNIFENINNRQGIIVQQ